MEMRSARVASSISLPCCISKLIALQVGIQFRDFDHGRFSLCTGDKVFDHDYDEPVGRVSPFGLAIYRSG